CSWFESRYPSNESLEFSRKSGSLLTPSNGAIWRLVTRLVTRNPHGARFVVVSADEVRTRPRSFAWVRAPHLSGMEAHVRMEVEPAFLLKPRGTDDPSGWFEAPPQEPTWWNEPNRSDVPP